MTNKVPAELGMPSQDAMWRAIKARDAGYSGLFVYGLITTGVYCRPPCPTRAAKPAHVRFFASPETAESAGFRPCKRCGPRAAESHTKTLMQAIAKYIDENAAEPLSLKRLALQAHLSPAYLQRTFKNALGVSPKAYHDAARLRLLKNGLRAGKTVLDAVADAGFQSTSRAYSPTYRSLGMTPSAYRAGAPGISITYAARSTQLGLLLMAATDRGVCFAQFGENECSLRTQLTREFPRADIAASSMKHSSELDVWINALELHIAGRAPRPDVPVDLRGTAFQILVWRFLMSVPEGQTISYSEVARGIGVPKAVRATASACGANRIAVLVPCHRVLRGDGDLAGYRWGIDRKRALLDREKEPFPSNRS